MTREARTLRNAAAASPQVPYGERHERVLCQDGFDAAFADVSGWPDYTVSPLVRLDQLARSLGLGSIYYKDESERLGLKSFKALGGAYAVASVVRRRVRAATGLTDVTTQRLLSHEFAEIAREVTVTCATDGNHGRSVAWGARLFGCGCVIFVPEQVSQSRRDAIAGHGAEVRETQGTYDDAVRHAAATAAVCGWTVVSDTSYPGYHDIPRDVMHGYGVMATEAARQLEAPPTHALVQAGVGALAAALCAYFWLQWGGQRPQFVVVEPTRSDCVYQSIAAGRRVATAGELDTMMAGLACGVVSELAWEIIHDGANAAVAIDDSFAADAMRLLARPSAGDQPMVAGESGGAGLAALLAARDDPSIRQTLALDTDSRVLLIGSEGDTDAAIYRAIVGRSAGDVTGISRPPKEPR